MGAAVGLRGDYEAGQLRGLASVAGCHADATVVGAGGDLRGRVAHRGGQDRRCRIADGAGLGAGVQCEGPGGLINGKAPGNASLLDDKQRQALARIVESGPIAAAHGVVRWRLIDLAQFDLATSGPRFQNS